MAITYTLPMMVTGNSLKRMIEADNWAASGITSFGLHTWHHLTLKVKAGAIEASIDNKSLATINDSSFVVGQVGIQVAPWINAQFDNFAVTPL